MNYADEALPYHQALVKALLDFRDAGGRAMEVLDAVESLVDFMIDYDRRHPTSTPESR